MRKPYLLLPLLLLSACALLPGYVPTPDSAVAFHIEKDPRPWQIKYTGARSSGTLCMFGLKGAPAEKPQEVVSQEIVLTQKPLRDFLAPWKTSNLYADPAATISETTLTNDNSILITFTSPIADETLMRRLIPGSDGIYMLTYVTSPNLKKDDTWALWEDIIKTATLIPNPAKKK